MNRPSRPFVGVLLAAGTLLLLACERPPMEATQGDFRGLGVEQVRNPRLAQRTLDANVSPDPMPAVEAAGQPASAVYQNVPLLGHQDVADFNRLMGAIYQWVSPQQGCTYCHEGGFANDDAYTKIVSRRMIQMTQRINAEWKDHVGDTGVTCYTCHRGQNVPARVWSHGEDPGRPFLGAQAGQNAPAYEVGLTSLPGDPFTAFLSGESADIRIQSQTVLPAGSERNIKDAEWTYGLMVHLSEALGVNCTHCHNSRAFSPWEQSSPARVKAWHAIRMVREINDEYMESIADVLPPHRLGPAGDVLKVNCATCHQGLPKPLQGVSLLQHYPGLARELARADDGATDVDDPLPGDPEVGEEVSGGS